MFWDSAYRSWVLGDVRLTKCAAFSRTQPTMGLGNVPCCLLFVLTPLAIVTPWMLSRSGT